MPVLVSVVAHTHWDREWYAPFARFRLQLVELIDELIVLLEGNDSYTHFMLDGQLAIVDDYLEVRPENEARLRRLVTGGRLGVGPWYVLPDEFLVSGETLIRNLQFGLERAATLGGALEVGYLPDMFGHIAQMPQLLQLAGLRTAVVWRGVPIAAAAPGFTWQAPDGSSVQAEYLPQGYGNGAFTPQDANDLADRINAFHTANESYIDAPMLWMVGGDHTRPLAYLPTVLAQLAAHGISAELMSLPEHLRRRSQPTRIWKGELRSGARANLLMGVASNRSDIKAQAALLEQSLERVAEPLAALFARDLPAALHLPWRLAVQNAAHDSICACSADEVTAAVVARYRAAQSHTDAVIDAATNAFGRTLRTPGPFVVNTLGRARRQIVEIETGDLAFGGQTIDELPAVSELRVPVASAAVVVERELEIRANTQRVLIDTTDSDVLRIELVPGSGTRLVAQPIVADIAATAASRHGAALIRAHEEPRRRVLASASAPAFGWSMVEAQSPDPPVRVGRAELANGYTTVTVAPNGSWLVNGHGPLGVLCDGGDAGDTYNYSPPLSDVEVSVPSTVEITVIEEGPLRGILSIYRVYDVPEQLHGDTRSTTLLPLAIRTQLTLCAGESFVRVCETVHNAARDHRLRAHFRLPRAATVSEAECAFTIVERPLTAEGGATETGLPTFPSRRFVRAGGLTIVHRGLLEYELTDIAGGRAQTLALTLLRATGWLSRGPFTYRALPAGPELALEAAQMPGPHHFDYALTINEAYEPYELADTLVPLTVGYSHGGGWRPNRGQLLELDTTAEVSAVTRDDKGRLVLRVFNPTERAAELRTLGEFMPVDLRGNQLGEHRAAFTLRPFEILTLREGRPASSP